MRREGGEREVSRSGEGVDREFRKRVEIGVEKALARKFKEVPTLPFNSLGSSFRLQDAWTTGAGPHQPLQAGPQRGPTLGGTERRAGFQAGLQ